MIVAVCANPALDVTYRVPVLKYGSTHTVAETHVRAGGKGTNVARVLHQLAVPVVLVAPLGGRSGAEFREHLPAGLPLAATEIAASTRTCVVVADDRDATVFNERGPLITQDEWSAVVDAVTGNLGTSDVLVLSGSLPPGAPEHAYAQLVELARRRGARSIVDAHSQPLDHALRAGADVVAPNHGEARLLVGDHDVPTSAALLRDRGAGAAVVSAGEHGVHAHTEAGLWSVRPPRIVYGNPTGAGDALTAAIAAGLYRGDPWPDILRDAVAGAAAAVASPVAGELDLEVRDELLAAMTQEGY